MLWSPSVLSDAVPWCVFQSICVAILLLVAAGVIISKYESVKDKAQKGRSVIKGAMPHFRKLVDGRLLRGIATSLDLLSAPKSLAITGAVGFAMLALPVNYSSMLGYLFEIVHFLWSLCTGLVWYPLSYLVWYPLRHLVINILTWPLGLATYFVIYPLDYCVQVALGRLLWMATLSLVDNGSPTFGWTTQAVESTCDDVHVLLWPFITGALCGVAYLAMLLYRWETSLQNALVDGNIFGARANDQQDDDNRSEAFALATPTSAEGIRARQTRAEGLNSRLQALVASLEVWTPVHPYRYPIPFSLSHVWILPLTRVDPC